MNSYEISKDMCPDYGPMCNKCNANGHCLIEYLAKSLIRKSYHKVADDEMVVKKSEYEKLSKDYATINNEAYYCGLSVGKEEAAIEVADKIYNKLTESDVWHDMKKIWWRHNNECYELKGVLKQVLKELGIDLEG